MTQEHEHFPDAHHDTYSKTVFGFWIYLLTDFILFAALFATYAVLQTSTFGGASSHELFYLPFNLIQTVILLAISLTSGMGGAYAHQKNAKWTIVLFAITVVLGIVFMGMQFYEFHRLIQGGHRWDGSAFLSTFFSLLGTYGLHMLFAILWTLVLLPLVFFQGITPPILRRLTCMKMFWQFLNIIWIFIFTLVYLLGGELA